MSDHLDLLCTEGLIDCGVVDVVWGRAWRPATTANWRAAQNGHDTSTGIALPRRATIACFAINLPEMMEQLGRDGGGGHYVLVVRDGDPSISRGWPDCVHHVFASSVVQQSDRVTAMPMAFHAFYDDRMKDGFVERSVGNRVLVSFSLDFGTVTGNPNHERMRAIAHFAGRSWATVPEALCAYRPGQGVWLQAPLPWREYVALLRSHEYLCCPVGYGVERIASWEAMTLGTIPICIRHPELLHFADMPIAFVDNWSEVTPEWCDANRDVIRRPMEKLKLSYWVERVRAKVSELC